MIEVELKSLISDTSKAQEIIHELPNIYPGSAKTEEQQQLNHYFDTKGNLSELYNSISQLLDSEEKKSELKEVLNGATDFSMRSREINGSKVLFVLKLKGNSSSSSNGKSRREFEEVVNISLQQLDELILACGFDYLSKWSRSREVYMLGGNTNTTLCFDKNAGYGYLIEVEKVVDNETDSDSTEQELQSVLKKLGLVELDEGRLDRMFSYYNKNWKDYYGTEKVFVIE